MSARRFDTRRVQGGRSATDYQIVIAYDGEKTEDEYFRGWQLLLGESYLTISPIYVTSGGNPLKAVEASLKKLKKHRDCAEFWCVADVDDTDVKDVAAANILAQQYDIRLCLSRRCFEVWMALHFGKCNKPILSEMDAIDIVSAHLPNFTARNKSAHFGELWRLTDVAIQNAEWLRAQEVENPSTNVHALVRKLRDNLSEKTRGKFLS